MSRWLVDVDRLLASHLIPLHVSLKLLVFVREHELVRQVILVEVVDKIPETLLVLLFRPEEV